MLKKELAKFGNWGKIILILIMAFQVVFVFLPGEVIEIAAGFSYETFEGLIICLLGTIIGTVIIYSFLNKYGIKFINKFYDTSKINQIKFLKKEKHLEIIIFIIFFIPGTPKDLITYLAPFTRLKLTTFLAISSIARIPSIITSTISGSALSNQNYQLTIWVFIITGIISILGLLIYKFYVHKKNL
ncbi:TVP38/TMEM64 family protein [Thomasclavelia spiroformis]|uniref:TVP38/TMEM64 family protein n=1 Tax=Thomasclavelia spiroformis TaxID=29348 RepID=UPI00399948A9